MKNVGHAQRIFPGLLVGLAMLFFFAAPIATKTVSAQPAYRLKQERLLGQSGGNTSDESTPKRTTFDLRNPETIRQYTGKEPGRQPFQSPDAEEKLSSIRRGLSSTRVIDTRSYGSILLSLLLFLALLGGIGFLWYYNHYYLSREKKGSYDDPRELFVQLCRLHGLDRKDQAFLRSLAERLDIVNVLLLFIEPSFFQHAMSDPDFLPEQRQLQQLHQRLFGEADELFINRRRFPVEMSKNERTESPRAPESTIVTRDDKSTVLLAAQEGSGSKILSRSTIIMPEKKRPTPSTSESQRPLSTPQSPDASTIVHSQDPRPSGKPPASDGRIVNSRRPGEKTFHKRSIQAGFLGSFTETVTSLVTLLRRGFGGAMTDEPRPDTLTYRPERSHVTLEETLLDETPPRQPGSSAQPQVTPPVLALETLGDLPPTTVERIDWRSALPESEHSSKKTKAPVETPSDVALLEQLVRMPPGRDDLSGNVNIKTVGNPPRS